LSPMWRGTARHKQSPVNRTWSEKKGEMGKPWGWSWRSVACISIQCIARASSVPHSLRLMPHINHITIAKNKHSRRAWEYLDAYSYLLIQSLDRPRLIGATLCFGTGAPAPRAIGFHRFFPSKGDQKKGVMESVRCEPK